MLKLDLWQAFERHLRKMVCRLADPDEIARLPQLNGSLDQMNKSVLLYMEILDNWKRATVRPRPRKVHFSDVLTAAPRYSECEPRILKIQHLLETGSSELNDPRRRYFSRLVERILDRKQQRVRLDRILVEWGIYHFHLGEGKRTKDLLFALVRENDAYFIDVCDHDDFTNVTPLEIAQRNWPQLFDDLPGIHGSRFTAEHIGNLRRQNANFSPDINGLALMPRDMVTCAGGTARILTECDWMMVTLLENQRQLCTPGSELRRQLANVVRIAEDVMDLEVVDDDNNFGDRILLKEASTGEKVGLRFSLFEGS